LSDDSNFSVSTLDPHVNDGFPLFLLFSDENGAGRRFSPQSQHLPTNQQVFFLKAAPEICDFLFFAND